MASAFQSGAFQAGAFQIDVTPLPVIDYNPSNLDGHVRMYGSGGVYRPRDEDVADLLKLLFPEKKRRKKLAARVREFEDAAMALLNTTEPEVRKIVADYAGPLMRGRARQAELQTLVQVMLQKAADEAEAVRRAFEEDEEDVMLLLGAL